MLTLHIGQWIDAQADGTVAVIGLVAIIIVSVSLRALRR